MASTTIYVGGLSQYTNEDALLAAFSPFGDVIDVQIPKDKGRSDGDANSGGRSNHRGFGFIVFSEPQEAQDAIDNMHLNELQGVSVGSEGVHGQAS